MVTTKLKVASMFATEQVQKGNLGKLPEQVFTLLEMGHYSLYSVRVEGHPEVSYALRTGGKEIFFLENSGKPINLSDLKDFQVLSRVTVPSSKSSAISNARPLI
jgi:hypothetical protein